MRNKETINRGDQMVFLNTEKNEIGENVSYYFTSGNETFKEIGGEIVGLTLRNFESSKGMTKGTRFDCIILTMIDGDTTEKVCIPYDSTSGRRVIRLINHLEGDPYVILSCSVYKNSPIIFFYDRDNQSINPSNENAPEPVIELDKKGKRVITNQDELDAYNEEEYKKACEKLIVLNKVV